MLIEARKRIAFLALPLWTLLIIVLTAMSVFLLVHLYVASSPHPFDSDDLLCSDVCGDLLHGRNMSGWRLPCAPYLFPDLLLLAPCRLLAPNIVVEFLAYCLLFHLSLLAILAWLGRLSGLGWPQTWTAAGCGTLLLAAAHLNEQSISRVVLLVHPGSHTGALLVGLFLLALTVRALRYGQSWLGAAVFILAGGLGMLSDKLVAAQLLAPLALALLVLSACRIIGVRQAAGQGLLFGASFLFSLAITSLLQRLGLQFMEIKQLGVRFLDLKPPFLHLNLGDLSALLRQLSQALECQYVVCALIPLHLLAALFLLLGRHGSRSCRTAFLGRPDRLVSLSYKTDFRAGPTKGILSGFSATSRETGLDSRVVMAAALTLLLSPLCIIAALMAGGMARHYGIYRYTLSCWFLPCLFLPLLLCWLPGRIVRTAGSLVQCSVVLLAVQRIIALAPGIERWEFEQPYPPLAQALDRLARQHGPLRGLAGYWLARPISWFCREDVAVSPLLQMAAPWFHGCNPNRFLSVAGDDLHIPDLQFLLLRSGDAMCPSPNIATLVFGPPREKIAVGPDEIWLYDSLRSSAFDRFLRSRLAERLHSRRPYTGPVSPACLAQPKANMTPAGARSTVAVDPQHPLEIRFAAPIAGQLIDLGANYSNQYDLEFFRGEERVGGLHVPAVPMTGATFEPPGIQARLLPLPAPLTGKKWDRVLVHPVEGTGDLSLGHFLVFAQGLPDPPPRPRSFPPRVRLTANDLYPRLGIGGDTSLARLEKDIKLIWSPEMTLPPGRYRLEYAVKAPAGGDANEAAHVAAVWCRMPLTVLAVQTLRGSDSRACGECISQTLTFEIAEEKDFVLFGLLAAGETPVVVDRIELTAEPPIHPQEPLSKRASRKDAKTQRKSKKS